MKNFWPEILSPLLAALLLALGAAALANAF